MSNIRKKIAACLAVLLLFSVTSCENLNKAAQNDGQQIEVTKHIEVESVPEYAGQPYVTIHDNKPDLRRQNLLKMCLSLTVNWMQKADVAWRKR